LFKKIFIYILCLIPWFFSSLIPVDYSFYQEINLPFFAPPSIFYAIAWTIIYLSITVTISQIFLNNKFKNIPKSYKLALLINYLFNQSFTLVFFGLKNLFLGFISCLATFISCLYLYQETSYLKEKSIKFLDPYILLSLFATILSITIYLINTL